MFNNQVLSCQNLENFNFEETKKRLKNYFNNLEILVWEWEKLNAQKGLIANYNFSLGHKSQAFIPIGQDDFNMSAKEMTEEQLISYISNYQRAKSVLSDMEKSYIKECFVNRKHEGEIIEILGFENSDSNGFRKLKRSAVYKFADFLDLVVEKK